MTLELGKTKTAAVDAIRRLMEKLPLVEPLDLMTSETEVWSGYAYPILDSLLSIPEEKVHLRWTNTQDVDDNPERPDSVITIISESRWSRNFGHGEAKVSEPTDNVALLSWDLCRLAFFNKNSINKNETSFSFSFQVKGPNLTRYVTELAADGAYSMTEISLLDIPMSVQSLDKLTTPKALRQLLQIAHGTC
ncbi:hypothetical protein BDC45DRAFT_218910 [Circinella umbellata]|nr:hypothetical protein BDC45DRAFT_218910 [Circinella umbellata]